MKPWRPDNWDKIKLEKVNIGNHPTQVKVAFLNFEAGADALLESLERLEPIKKAQLIRCRPELFIKEDKDGNK